jgi:hypothetical protein
MFSAEEIEKTVAALNKVRRGKTPSLNKMYPPELTPDEEALCASLLADLHRTTNPDDASKQPSEVGENPNYDWIRHKLKEMIESANTKRITYSTEWPVARITVEQQ